MSTQNSRRTVTARVSQRVTAAYRPGAPSMRRYRSLEPEGAPVSRPTKAEAARSFNRAMRLRGEARQRALREHYARVNPHLTDRTRF
ncbi:hypothetical protein [Nocardiopsis quinghaiensis]|uniref:hypothetical protein n=1 Tax=Nocardiopsis quinghaiensis TaxID=464995 RepID=UPI001239C8AE|nr:hypothetical protein [Nocardiopsis quinghaiensis]